MTKPTKLYRTTITVWSENPIEFYGLQEVNRLAQVGEIFCTLTECEEVIDTKEFPDTGFFE